MVLWPRSGHEIVDVLANTIGIVAGHHAIERILATSIADEGSTITVAIQVIVSEMVGLPDFELRFRNYVTTNIKYLAAYRKRNSGIARCSQRGCVRCDVLVERSEFVPWSRLARPLPAHC